MNFPDKKYGIIYIDPAWEYECKSVGGSGTSGASSKYEVMSNAELKNYQFQKLLMKIVFILLGNLSKII